MDILTRHSRAGGNPAKKITRIAEQQRLFDRFANCYKQPLVSRLRGNDEVGYASRGIRHAA